MESEDYLDTRLVSNLLDLCLLETSGSMLLHMQRNKPKFLTRLTVALLFHCWCWCEFLLRESNVRKTLSSAA